MQHDGGRHGREGPLAGLDLVASSGTITEAAHDVVEQYARAVRHYLGAVKAVQGVGVAYDISSFVDHRKMRGVIRLAARCVVGRYGGRGRPALLDRAGKILRVRLAGQHVDGDGKDPVSAENSARSRKALRIASIM